MTDKYDTELFEGDLVESFHIPGLYVIVSNRIGWALKHKDSIVHVTEEVWDGLTKIGNKYDNVELLKLHNEKTTL